MHQFIRGTSVLPLRFLCTPPSTKNPAFAQQQERLSEIPESEVSPRRKFFIQFLGMVVGGGLATWAYLFGQFVLEWPEPCQVVIDAGARSPLIIERIGIPFRRSLLWSGTVDELRCNVSIPISGPCGAGVLHGRCVNDRQWKVVSLSCQFGDEPRREDLL